MAAADEDEVPRDAFSAEDTDLTDETQDFRFLASLSREDAAVPKRGEKDFEPHATALQSNTLAASRQAMHNAISFRRVHQPRGYNAATYHPETNMAYIYNPKGPHFAKMGEIMSAKDDPLGNDELRGQRMWLLPEEVIYLLERGSLDVRWPASEEDEQEAMGLPMSLQAAYAMLIGDEDRHRGALTFERYSVYTGLKRMGYTVLRAPTWNAPAWPENVEHTLTAPPSPRYSWQVGLSHYYSSWWDIWPITRPENPNERQAKGPLVRPQLYRNYTEIYRRLALINFHDPTSQTSMFKREQPDDDFDDSSDDPSYDPFFRVTYQVWKPGSQTFKKSSPGPPDFRVAVVDARETAIPTLEQLSLLLDAVPYDKPVESAQLYQKLKHGYKNVVLAVVDQGVVSYLRVSDAGFGREKLFERKGSGAGGKRGGRGGRGRGR